jgi:Yip1 domain
MIATKETSSQNTSFWNCLFSSVVAPRMTFERLMHNPRRLELGFKAVALVAAGYTISLALITWGGGQSRIAPWLAIPLESYFFWETFFIGIVTLGCWVLASGVVQLLCNLAGGKGSFEDTAALLGFAIAVPTLLPLLIDLIKEPLVIMGYVNILSWTNALSTPGFWMILMLIYIFVYLIGLGVLFPLTTMAAHGLRGWKAVGIGLVGAMVYQGVYFIFVR